MTDGTLPRTYSTQDIQDETGVSYMDCRVNHDGQLVFYLQFWQWRDGSIHDIPESGHQKYLDCVKARLHYITYDGHCLHCGSGEL